MTIGIILYVTLLLVLLGVTVILLAKSRNIE